MSKNIDLEDLLRRVETLERAVLVDGTPKMAKASRTVKLDNFDGATGGVRFLFSKGFFNTRRQLAEVLQELQSHEYHYSRQAIDMALKRSSTKSGPLVALKEKGSKEYVKRK
jgi:hypothetical protein